MPRNNNRFPPLIAMALAFALTLCAAARAFSAQPGAAHRIITPRQSTYGYELTITPTLKWTPDGSRILFGKDNRLYTVASDGSNLRNLAGSTPSDQSFATSYWFRTEMCLSADVSPDGSRIVYATCEYITEPKPWRHEYADDSELQSFVFSHAEWSPDGNGIAVAEWYGFPSHYEGGPVDYRARELGDPFLFVISPDGSDRRDLAIIDDDGELRAANRR